MIRKGRSAYPASDAGYSARGPRGDESLEASNETSEDFDPFESFDAHDRADGRGSNTRAAGNDSSSAETTYTRSRRQPGEARSADSAANPKSQRPARSLKGRALGYLSRREYSRSELSRKLAPYAEEGESIDTLLDSLESEGWLSNSRFAESLLHRRASRMGAGRIVNELKRHAVGQELVEEVSAQLRETELSRAQAVWRKKFGQLPETPQDRAKQARFLATRGFSQGIIGKILKGIDEDWTPE